jgi:hypothetical protein
MFNLDETIISNPSLTAEYNEFGEFGNRKIAERLLFTGIK